MPESLDQGNDVEAESVTRLHDVGDVGHVVVVGSGNGSELASERKHVLVLQEDPGRTVILDPLEHPQEVFHSWRSSFEVKVHEPLIRNVERSLNDRLLVKLI